MILWLPINVERRHLREKKIKNCIVAVNGPTMGFFFVFFSRTCTHAHMLRNYRARADVGAQSDALTRVRGFHWWKGERSGTPAEGLMGLRLWAGKCGLLFFLSPLLPMVMMMMMHGCSCSSCLPERSHFTGDTPLEFGRCRPQFNRVN